MLKKYIGDKQFYHSVLLIVIPIMIQNGITNFVNLLDNIMIGRVGTLQMTGVAITNQLIFVFNLCIFGAISGAGIFTAQYYGIKDEKGIRFTLRFKLIICMIIFGLGAIAFGFWGNELIGLYLKGEGTKEDVAQALFYGRTYLNIMMIGLVPFALTQGYAGTLRETGETMLPMKAGIAAVLTNLVLDYVLIFGVGPIPALGVVGAAMATVTARFAEFFIVFYRVKAKKKKYPYMNEVLVNFHIPRELTVKIIKTGIPLLINEGLWSLGMATLNQCYSFRSLDAVAAVTIQGTIWNVFAISFLAMGNAVGIIVGQILGRGEVEEAVDSDRKLMFFAIAICIVSAIIEASVAGLFPQVYNTSAEIKQLATQMILVGALFMPLEAYVNAAYFTIRAGGKTFITFLFDSAFMWCVHIPIAYGLSRFTNIPVIRLFLICQALVIIKCCIGFFMIQSRAWVQNLV